MRFAKIDGTTPFAIFNVDTYLSSFRSEEDRMAYLCRSARSKLIPETTRQDFEALLKKQGG